MQNHCDTSEFLLHHERHCIRFHCIRLTAVIIVSPERHAPHLTFASSTRCIRAVAAFGNVKLSSMSRRLAVGRPYPYCVLFTELSSAVLQSTLGGDDAVFTFCVNDMCIDGSYVQHVVPHYTEPTPAGHMSRAHTTHLSNS